ncbi:hypothetical protein [Okeania sp.]|uniref:hypothetical protein n=1 Tax=Okeania sp. TaxID=3100323 RepID=UPI002B4B310B|nr:hypothetical protein [Okeania sp.]MEB3339241.1 hypothetical protein [Okeania sp.]
MQIFRQYIAPLIVVIIFLLAMVAVSARIFLPGDLAAPAPTEELSSLPVQYYSTKIFNKNYVNYFPDQIFININFFPHNFSILS